MSDLENCKMLLTNARVPFTCNPTKAFLGYVMVETPHTYYTFESNGGKCIEIVQKDTTE